MELDPPNFEALRLASTLVLSMMKQTLHPSFTPMNDSVKHLILAVLLVAFTAVSGRTAFPQASVLTAPATAGDVHLTASFPKQDWTPAISSQSEVLRFRLEADLDYTLRYVPLQVTVSGLQVPTDPTAWSVYPVANGRVDFSSPMGYGERYSDGLLRLRFYSFENPALGYWGSKGSSDFALVTSVLTAPDSSAPTLTASWPTDLSSEWDWAFLPGQRQDVWMKVPLDEMGGGEEVTVSEYDYDRP